MARLRLGIKVSVRDQDDMLKHGPDFVETFIGAEDMLEGIDHLVQGFGSSGLPVVVHVPEFYGDIFVDLATPDEKVWESSFEAVKKSVALADELEARHIVLHPGGNAEGDIDRPAAIKRLRTSLQELSYDKLYLENMPWFYFQARERMVRSNIMVDVSDFEEVLDVIGGITVDVCHGFLSIKGGSMDYLLSFFDLYPGVDRYYHLSDAMPPDGEGLQIGEGAIDWGPIYQRLKGKDAWGIPEIMGGHADGGAGFAKAIEILRTNGL
jgi:N-acetylneuraminate synthase